MKSTFWQRENNLARKIKRFIQTLFGLFGYQLHQISRDGTDEGYVLRRYVNRRGYFDYPKYVKEQKKASNQKKDEAWVIEENIAFLSEYLKEHLGQISFGICHGTRRGLEQEWFNKYLGCKMIGTEISDLARNFPNTIQWDFHNTKPEWINSVDFIYSNSFDHSYDPETCLNSWISCLVDNGICIIEHSAAHEPSGVTDTDPFGVELSILPFVILQWGRGRYSVSEVIKAPSKSRKVSHVHFVIIKKHTINN